MSARNLGMGNNFDTHALNFEINGEENEFMIEDMKKAMPSPEKMRFGPEPVLINVTAQNTV